MYAKRFFAGWLSFQAAFPRIGSLKTKKGSSKRAATNTSIRDFTLHKQCRLSPAPAMLPERREKAAQQSDLAHSFACTKPAPNRLNISRLLFFIFVIQCKPNSIPAYKSWQAKIASSHLILKINGFKTKNANNQQISKSISKTFIPIAAPRNSAATKKLPHVFQRGHKRNTNHYQMDYTAAKFVNNFCCRVAGETNSTLFRFFMQMIVIIIL